MIQRADLFQRFVWNLKKIFHSYLLGFILFFVFRLVFLLRFSPEGVISQYNSELIHAFLVGIRFDTMVLCYILTIPTLFAVLLLFVSSDKFHRYYERFCNYYLGIVFSLVSFLLITDQQYYTYFQTHFSVIVFGFFEDDTQAVLKSMWTDHPVIIITLLMYGLCFGIFRVSRMIWFNQDHMSHKNLAKRVYAGLFVVFFALGMRGSIGLFPLNSQDASICENEFVNTIPVNGIFALKTAFKERGDAQKSLTPEQVLRAHNRQSVNELIRDYYSIPEDSIKGSYLDYLYKTAPENTYLLSNQPDVVFVLMESFGGYFLNFHSESLNLLGELEKHIGSDYFFRNFLSSTTGTIYSLESIVSNTTGWPLLSNTSKRFIPQTSSIAYPFKTAGYETIFLTAGQSNWRNLNELLPSMYFDKVLGSSFICKDIPGAREKTWGVADEFLYKEIFKMLDEKPRRPRMIFALTTMNHTPYEFPSTYKGYPINIPDSLSKIIIANKDIAELVFKSYQYSTNSFGEFMTALKSSSHSKNTIVGATGDHNSYTLFPLEVDIAQVSRNYSVPFYLYLPESLKQNKYANCDRAGSHKDIWPTIIPNALSGQRYFSVGNNLLEADSSKSFYFGDNLYAIYQNPWTASEDADRVSKARRQLIEYYFSDYYSGKAIKKRD